jgi:hypothetical protein
MHQDIRKAIIENFQLLKGQHIPISYLLKKIDVNSIQLYKEIHEMLTDGTLIRVYVSTCPVCEYENLSTEDAHIIICDNCCERYMPSQILEKFKLTE